MSLFRHAVRDYLIHRLERGRHPGYRYSRRHPGYRRHRRTYPVVLGRPRRRSRVHVTGCCLPLPLGVLLSSLTIARLVIRRR